MMNDRFGAQLRQHLLDTANDRPADGQLAALAEGISATNQRHPLVARLTSPPGRIGPFLSATARYGVVAAALVVATVAAAVFFAGGSSRSTDFEGTWTSTDPGDGSTQTLVVAAGSRPTVHYVDEVASTTSCEFDAVKVFTADGTGTIAGDRLDVVWPDGGSCGITTQAMDLGPFAYDDATGSLIDDQRITWLRAQSAAAPPTRGPLTSLRPLPCVDHADGTYQQRLGSLQVTANLPIGWHGRTDRILLENSLCLFDGWVRLEAEVVGEVYADPCHQGPGVALGDPATTTAFSIMDELDATGPTETTIGGHPAVRWTFSVPATFNVNACDRNVFRLWGGTFDPDLRAGIDPGETVTVYLLRVEGTPIGFAAIHNDVRATPAMLAELDAVVASLLIEP